MNEIVEQAKEMAYRAHAGQTDKAGQPYINHVARVAADVASCPKVGPEAEAASWLHDVVEDHPEYEGAVNNQMPEPVTWAVRLLNRNNESSEEAYYRHIRENTIALTVKLADIADNTEEERLSALDEATRTRLQAKYALAKELLGV